MAECTMFSNLSYPLSVLLQMQKHATACACDVANRQQQQGQQEAAVGYRALLIYAHLSMASLQQLRIVVTLIMQPCMKQQLQILRWWGVDLSTLSQHSHSLLDSSRTCSHS